MTEYRLGGMAPPLKEQLPELDANFADRCDKLSEAITRLLMGDILTHSQSNKARDKLAKQINEKIKENKQ